MSEPTPSKPGDHDEKQNVDDSWYDDLTGTDDVAGFGFTIGDPHEEDGEDDDEDEEDLETDPDQD